MSDPTFMPPQRETLTPSALTRIVRDLLEDALPLIWIEGEISNLSRPASGHLYFTLKDSAAQVRCAMFRPKSTWLRFTPANGMQVL
ncbi:MAG: exodeoxyribonuclease VII large subunit, partial [Rhodanobacteraceae bacterium]